MRGQSRIGRKTEACSSDEAGTHRSKGIGMSSSQETSRQAGAVGILGLQAGEDVNAWGAL